MSGVFYATAIGLCMLIGRYWIIVRFAIAGSCGKNIVPAGGGTGHAYALFVLFLAGTVVLVGEDVTARARARPDRRALHYHSGR